MRSMYWQLGILGTISAFAHGHRKTKKNLCRGGRSQDLPDPALLTADRLQYKAVRLQYKAVRLQYKAVRLQYIYVLSIFFPPCVAAGQEILILEVYISHTTTHHTQ
jgi:hypothetical protein